MKYRILQIASFSGNIGDNANHLGFRNLLKTLYPSHIFEFTDFEIRSTFRKESNFDNDKFVELVEQHDLVFFGGGNFFELWVDHSQNNTSVDIPISTLRKITKPIIFYSLGLDINMGYSQKGISKFCKWLDYVVCREDFVLSLRNDGSFSTMQKILPEKYHKHFKKIPDGGFFIEPLIKHSKEKFTENKLIGINIAGDMLDLRFNESTSSINYLTFINEFTVFLETSLSQKKDLKFMFFPHIYKDFKVINDILSKINEKYARERIFVNQYSCGDEFAKQTFKSYRECDVILANRFHSNVCAIGMAIPTVGLLNYNQIEYLYSDLNFNDNLVDVRKKGFSKLLTSKINRCLNEKQHIRKQYYNTVNQLKDELKLFLKGVINSL